MNKLAETELRDRLKSMALNKLYWPNKAPLIVETRNDLYEHAATAVGRDAPVLYLEFGVAHGGSMRAMAGRFTHPDSRFHGFDSFVGLPENWLTMPQGTFSNKGRPPRIDDPRVSFVQGWFQNSLHPFLRSFTCPPGHTVLINFDADLYSSTLFLLSALWPYFTEYYFTMDDFVHDDAVALFDFVSAYPVQLSFLAQRRGGGTRPNPDQVFGHMKRIPMVVEGVEA